MSDINIPTNENATANEPVGNQPSPVAPEPERSAPVEGPSIGEAPDAGQPSPGAEWSLPEGEFDYLKPMPGESAEASKIKSEGVEKVQAILADREEKMAAVEHEVEGQLNHALSESEKMHAAGFTKYDVMRFSNEHGGILGDGKERTVDDYKAIKHQWEEKFLANTRKPEDVPHTIMQVKGDKLLTADVGHFDEAATMIRYSKDNGLDCLCCTSNGFLVFGGESPTMKSVISDFENAGSAVTSDYQNMGEMTLAVGDVRANFNAFSTDYAMHATRNAYLEGGAKDFGGITYVKAANSSRDELVSTVKNMNEKAMLPHGVASRYAENGSIEVGLNKSNFSSEFTARHAPERVAEQGGCAIYGFSDKAETAAFLQDANRDAQAIIREEQSMDLNTDTMEIDD